MRVVLYVCVEGAHCQAVLRVLLCVWVCLCMGVCMGVSVYGCVYGCVYVWVCLYLCVFEGVRAVHDATASLQASVRWT